MNIGVEFRIQFATRRDDEANVFVGYCPTLDLYSQGTTEDEAARAVVSAAKLFIVSCYERDILHSALRKRGMTKASAKAIDKNEEYIAVPDYDHTFAETIPLHLLSSSTREEELCHQP